MTKGNHMTNISKEAVERNSITRALCMFEDEPDTTGVSVTLGDLRALSARVEELEADMSRIVDANTKSAMRSRERGRLQGLNEAKAKVEELWAGRTCREVAEAIEALKGETTND